MHPSTKFAALTVAFLATNAVAADTLIMRDGRELTGQFIGSTAQSVHVRTAKGIERFALRDVHTIRLEPRAATRERKEPAAGDDRAQRAIIVGQGQTQSIERVGRAN